jgi:hypothetical protein
MLGLATVDRMSENQMAEEPLEEREPPWWAFWRFGPLAYRMIREHQRHCIELGRTAAEAIGRIEGEIGTVKKGNRIISTQVNDVLQAVNAFTEMQPKLRSSLRLAEDHRVIMTFLAKWGRIFGAILAGSAAAVAIGVWIVPIVKAYLGVHT